MARMEIEECIEVLDDYLLEGECRITKVAWVRIRAKLVENLPTSTNTQSTPCSHRHWYACSHVFKHCPECGALLPRQHSVHLRNVSQNKPRWRTVVFRPKQNKRPSLGAKEKKNMRLSVNNPNLSVILPVGCNGNCAFCYWKQSDGLTVSRFKFVCDTLPAMFKQCSITGGEPTLCTQLQEYIEVAMSRFEKVVLNTNGFALTDETVTSCDFINISRHHYLDDKNKAIFALLNKCN